RRWRRRCWPVSAGTVLSFAQNAAGRGGVAGRTTGDFCADEGPSDYSSAAGFGRRQAPAVFETSARRESLSRPARSAFALAVSRLAGHAVGSVRAICAGV